jgi:hypothetical protein
VESHQLFIVQSQDGSIYTGTLTSTALDPSNIEVAEAERTKTVIEQSKVVRLEETSESFIPRLSGDINAGVVYSKGNNATQYTVGSEIEYRRERWGVQTDFNSNLSSSTGSATSTRNQVDLSGYRLMPWKNYFYGGLGSVLQSSVQGISRQTTVGGGLGRYLKNTNRARISLLGGVAWQTAKYEPTKVAIATQQVGAGLIVADLRFYVFKKTNLTLRAYFLPSISEGSRARFSTNASYYLKLFRNFSWNLTFYGNWDSRPPANLPGSDYGYTAGIKWTFGYR